VLKKIAELSDIPRNDELKITTRATELMNKWKPIVDKAAGEPTKTNGSDDKAAAPAADMTPTATE
jgi:hypothetical protein